VLLEANVIRSHSYGGVIAKCTKCSFNLFTSFVGGANGEGKVPVKREEMDPLIWHQCR
jgi:hypothetical protein